MITVIEILISLPEAILALILIREKFSFVRRWQRIRRRKIKEVVPVP